MIDMSSEAYQFGLQDELEKIAAVRPGLVRRGLRRLFKGQIWAGSGRSGRWVKPLSAKAYQAKHVVPPPGRMFIPGIDQTPAQIQRTGKALQSAARRTERFYKSELPPFLAAGVKGPYTYKL